MHIFPWSSIETSIGGYKNIIRPNDEGFNGSYGFMMVFDNLEKFKEVYPNEEPLIVTTQK